MNLELVAFIVMPDHFHAVIVIGENQFNSPNKKRDREEWLPIENYINENPLKWKINSIVNNNQ
jgi:hypothetical protein